MVYTGPERRKYPRINARFIVSYRVLEEKDVGDTSQTKNLSLGGILFITKRAFAPGTILILEIRLPFDPKPVTVTGRVIESCEITKDLIYDTRLQFLALDEKQRKIINKVVDYYLKKEA